MSSQLDFFQATLLPKLDATRQQSNKRMVTWRWETGKWQWPTRCHRRPLHLWKKWVYRLFLSIAKSPWNGGTPRMERSFLCGCVLYTTCDGSKAALVYGLWFSLGICGWLISDFCRSNGFNATMAYLYLCMVRIRGGKLEMVHSNAPIGIRRKLGWKLVDWVR